MYESLVPQVLCILKECYSLLPSHGFSVRRDYAMEEEKIWVFFDRRKGYLTPGRENTSRETKRKWSEWDKLALVAILFTV